MPTPGERRPLGRSGLAVSAYSLGSMNFGKTVDYIAAAQIAEKFVTAGVNCVDTADSYGGGSSEEIVGNLRRDFGDELLICTKTGGTPIDADSAPGYSPAQIEGALDASLRRLKIDAIDIYQLHQWDPSARWDDVLHCLLRLREKGKIRSFGFGNMPSWALGEMHGYARALGVAGASSIQYHYSLACRDIELDILPTCTRHSVGLMAWSPLAGGALTGKYLSGTASGGRASRPRRQRGYALNRFGRLDQPIVSLLAGLARDLCTSPAALALSWLLAQGVTTVIVGAESVEQATEAVSGCVEITSATRELLERATAVPQVYPYDFLGDVLGDRVPTAWRGRVGSVS